MIERLDWRRRRRRRELAALELARQMAERLVASGGHCPAAFARNLLEAIRRAGGE